MMGEAAGEGRLDAENGSASHTTNMWKLSGARVVVTSAPRGRGNTTLVAPGSGGRARRWDGNLSYLILSRQAAPVRRTPQKSAVVVIRAYCACTRCTHCLIALLTLRS